jgi:hypothetical protein
MRILVFLLTLLAFPALAETVNVWLALRDDAQTAVINRLQCDRDPECVYDGPVTNRQARVFKAMTDRGTVQRLFKQQTAAGRVWTLWSVYFTEDRNTLLNAQIELDNLATTYPNQFRIAGAWWWDGRQIGTQWGDPVGDCSATTGTPAYPMPPQLADFMPGTDPTLRDVNIWFGQSPRCFQ